MTLPYDVQGFDVPDFGNVYAFGLILEIPLHDKGFSRILEEVWISTNEAIKYYNNENVIVLTI